MNKRSLFLASLVLTSQLFAAEPAGTTSTEGPQGTVTTTLPPANGAKIEGYIELRPTWAPNDSAVRMENNAYVGARLPNGWLLAYRQEFQNELSGGQGRGMVLGDGWIEYSAYPALSAGPLTVNVEFHGLLPTASTADESNYLFGGRTYLEGILQVYKRVGIFTRVMPRANAYKSGVFAGDRVRFENQAEVGPYVTLFSDRLTIRALARWTIGLLETNGAEQRWEHQLQLTPEILYQLTPSVVLGVNQCSGSMITEQFGGKAEALASAYRESVWQFMVQVTL